MTELTEGALAGDQFFFQTQEEDNSEEEDRKDERKPLFLFVTIPNKYVVLISLDDKTIKDEVSTHI